MWISELFITQFLILKYKQLGAKIYVHFFHGDSFFLELQLLCLDNVQKLSNLHKWSSYYFSLVILYQYEWKTLWLHLKSICWRLQMFRLTHSTFGYFTVLCYQTRLMKDSDKGKVPLHATTAYGGVTVLTPPVPTSPRGGSAWSVLLPQPLYPRSS